MEYMRERKRYLSRREAFLTAACALLILSAAVLITLNCRPIYYADIYHLNISAVSGLEPWQIRENYDALVRYCLFWSEDYLLLPSFMLSREARIHFAEVRQIFVAIQYVMLASLGVTAWGAWKQNRLRRYGYLKAGAVLGASLPAVLGIIVYAAWDEAFNLFHHAFFRNDYWIFDPAVDPVITILPDRFFLHCALAVVVFSLAGSLLCYGLYRLLRRRELEAAAAGGDEAAAVAVALADEDTFLERMLTDLEELTAPEAREEAEAENEPAAGTEEAETSGDSAASEADGASGPAGRAGDSPKTEEGKE